MEGTNTKITAVFNKKLLIVCASFLIIYIVLLILYVQFDKQAYDSGQGFAWIFMPFGWMGVYTLLAPLFFKDRSVVYAKQYIKGTMIISFVMALLIIFSTIVVYSAYKKEPETQEQKFMREFIRDLKKRNDL